MVVNPHTHFGACDSGDEDTLGAEWEYRMGALDGDWLSADHWVECDGEVCARGGWGVARGGVGDVMVVMMVMVSDI